MELFPYKKRGLPEAASDESNGSSSSDKDSQEDVPELGNKERAGRRSSRENPVSRRSSSVDVSGQYETWTRPLFQISMQPQLASQSGGTGLPQQSFQNGSSAGPSSETGTRRPFQRGIFPWSHIGTTTSQPVQSRYEQWSQMGTTQPFQMQVTDNASNGFLRKFSYDARQPLARANSFFNSRKIPYFSGKPYRRRRHFISRWFDKCPDAFTVCFLVINFVFLCLGGTMVGFGTVATVTESPIKALVNFDFDGKLTSDSEGVIQNALFILMICGAFIALLSFFAVVGVLQKISCILKIYSGIVLILLLSKIVAVGFAFYFHQALTDKLTDPLKKALMKNYDGQLDSSNIISRAFDYTHVFLGCCGVTSYKDFRRTKWIRRETTKSHPYGRIGFPITCCRMKDPSAFLKNSATANLSMFLNDPQCPHRVASSDNEYTGVPCEEKVKQLLMKKADFIYYMGTTVVCLELVSISFAVGMARDISNS